ncbi:MAG: hypothetical protein WEB03_07710 [Nitriliruptor sp.]|uniref:hypothetical protein n=1 Tax=Nitriliruptor sp. TaxID=2448056 RepID=UPI0034A00CE1
MTPPVHQYTSVPLAASPEEVCERLLADPSGAVRRATADALSVMGPHIRPWGLRISALPTTTASPTGPGELGCVEVTWSGPEEKTGWPALTGQLVAVPAGPGGSRLLFFSRRSPQGGLDTGRVDRRQGQHIVHVSIHRFLQDLADHLDDRGARPPTANVAGFERSPMFVHHLQALEGEAGAAHGCLEADLQKLAERATATALADAREPLRAGRFRAPASPAVRSRHARVGEPACAWVGWHGDEEATGWPQLELALLIEAHPGGTRLALLSRRAPGYDLSRPRADKQQRDQILRSAGTAFAGAVRDGLTGTSAGQSSSQRPHLVSAAN